MKISYFLFLAALARTGLSDIVQAREDDLPHVRKLNRHRHHHHRHRVHKNQADVPNLRSKPRVNDVSQGTLRTPVQGKSCGLSDDDPCVGGSFDAVIVGAGAAGVSAAARLKRWGYSVIVLEASPGTGSAGDGLQNGYGRARGGLQQRFGLHDKIDIGGEWVHTGTNSFTSDGGWNSPSALLAKALENLNDNPSKDFTSKLLDDCKFVVDGVDRTGKGDHRWKGYTWWDFINDEIVMHNGVQDFIRRGQQVTDIYESRSSPGEWVYAVDAAGILTAYYSHAVIVTVPMKQLQKDAIYFDPELPSSFTNAVANHRMAPGIKAWLQFNHRYHHDTLAEANYDKSKGDIGDGSLFYDETKGHPQDVPESYHYLAPGNWVKGYFAQGEMAEDICSKSDTQVKDQLMTWLRDTNDGYSSVPEPTNWFVINWSKEPFIETGYTLETTSANIQEFQKGYHSDRLYFAGEAVPVSADPADCGFMNGAINSGKEAAKKVDEWFCSHEDLKEYC